MQEMLPATVAAVLAILAALAFISLVTPHAPLVALVLGGPIGLLLTWLFHGLITRSIQLPGRTKGPHSDQG